jgi:coatomer subunit beta'
LLQYSQSQAEYFIKLTAAGQHEIDEDGIEEAFNFIEEFSETIMSGTWISNDCFVFANSKGSISYLIGNKVIKHCSYDKKYFIIGYDGKLNRLYLSDKQVNIISYQLLLPLV